jgi:hypothetical protein
MVGRVVSGGDVERNSRGNDGGVIGITEERFASSGKARPRGVGGLRWSPKADEVCTPVELGSYT